MATKKYFPDFNPATYTYEALVARRQELEYDERHALRRAVPRQQELKKLRKAIAEREAQMPTQPGAASYRKAA